MAVSSAGRHHVHSLEQIELYYRSVPMDIDSGYLFNIPIVSGIINFAHTQCRKQKKTKGFVPFDAYAPHNFIDDFKL